MPITKPLRTSLTVAAGLAIIFLILDFGYLWANVGFTLRQWVNFSGHSLAGQALSGSFPANTLVVNSLEIKAPIVYVDKSLESVFQAGLAKGVVHYPQTALPGQVGNCYIFGHSSDFFWKPGSFKNIFALLPRIQRGSAIVVSDSSGKSFTYTVTGSYKVAGNDTSVLNQATGGKKLLTLQTSYPIGTALARWVVVAQMN